MYSKVTSRCLPVTALAVTDLGGKDETYVLVGQGPLLKIVSLKTHLCLFEVKVFATQTIHGIVCSQCVSQGSEIVFLVWGGRSVIICTLQSPQTYGVHGLKVASEMQVTDWILQAAFTGSLNSNVLIGAALVTAHNSVHLLSQEEMATDSGSQYHVKEIACGPKSILYSSSIAVLSTKSLLVASGTVFGEILVWSCVYEGKNPSHSFSEWSSRTHHVFRGHHGSVFGVAISEMVGPGDAPIRFLASCSDDRTIQVWNIGPCLSYDDGAACSKSQILPPKNHETGFGTTESSEDSDRRMQVVSTYGHTSRIWGVNFIHPDELPSPLYLVSQGEDATLQQWRVSFSDDPSFRASGFDLISRDHFHSGKSIWSSAVLPSYDKKHLLLTGGADGSVISRLSHRTDSRFGLENSPYSVTFSDVLTQTAPGSEPQAQVCKNRMLHHYGWISETSLVATTNCGSVVQFFGLSHQHKQISWNFLEVPEKFGSYSVLAASAVYNFALIGADVGDLWLFCDGDKALRLIKRFDRKINAISLVQLPNDSKSAGARSIKLTYAVVTCMGSDTAHLIEIPSRAASDSSTGQHLTFKMPETFLITSGAVSEEAALLLLGSRAGAVACYQCTDSEGHSSVSASPILCKRRVHGQNAVTCIIAMPTSDSQNAMFLTCGRDGHYAIHKLELEDKSLKTIHRTSLPFGPYIEGAYFTSSNHSLYLYGFRSKNFVVFNESIQTETFSVQCGGAHRNWSYRADPDSETAGSFVWSQASSFHFANFTSTSHQILQAGGHGREMKAVACRSLSEKEVLVATGAEDTTIRLSTCAIGDSDDPVRSFRTLNKHTAGLQHLAWSPCGSLLLSSAGYEELYVWRVTTDIPCFGIGVVCEAELPKESALSDLRITKFDITAIVGDEDGRTGLYFSLTVVYSNSVLKVFRYSTRDNLFTLVRQGLYGSNCLTQVKNLGGPTDTWANFLTASTDGSIAAWKLTDIVRVSATHRLHQSSVKCLELHPLPPRHHLIVTGGDDNAIGLTIFRRDFPHEPARSTEGQQFATLLIPNAHAAAVTGLSILPSSDRLTINQNNSSRKGRSDLKAFFVCSVGCDQRFKTWRVNIDLSTMESSEAEDTLNAVTVIKEADEYTAIADAAAMTVTSLNGDSTVAKAVVAGVGLEVRSFGA